MTDLQTLWGDSVARHVDEIQASRLVHVRALAPDALTHKDGHLVGRLVPYNAPAMVLDRLPTGEVDIYTEGFRPGVFARQLRDPGNAGRVGLVHKHEGGLGFLAHGRSLDDRADGLWGSFRVISSRRADVADLLEDGIEGLSIEYRALPNGTTVDDDEIRWRTDAIIDGVALEHRGAYTEARVMAYRSEIEQHEQEQQAADAAADEAARVEAEADAARVAAEQEAVEADETRSRRLAEINEFLTIEQAKQAELEARFLRGA